MSNKVEKTGNGDRQHPLRPALRRARAITYPFLQWEGSSSLRICGPCCRSIKNGLIADLIQIVATMEIRSLGGRDHSGYYANTRLVRRTRAELEAEAHRIEKEEAAAIAETVRFEARRKGS
jgi:hypothetical protein